MLDWIKNLQNIQNDLVGILLTVLVTSVVNLFISIFDNIARLSEFKSNVNNDKYQKIMGIQPKLRSSLQSLDLVKESMLSAYKRVGGNETNKMLNDCFRIYIDNETEGQDGNHAIKVVVEEGINNYLESAKHTYEELINCEFPQISFPHLILKKRRKKVMYKCLRFLTACNNLSNKSISGKTFINEINDLRSIESIIKDTINLLDKWIYIY